MKLLIQFLAFCCLGLLCGAETNGWWALRPLAVLQPPQVADNPRPKHAVDAFIQAACRERGLETSPEADRRTLLRRLSFDLTGLAPGPDEVRRFESDRADGAYERAVDALLQSPRYGERWARHWMDAVHFAETHGHDQDRIRTNAWPYRDYLIASFNQDKPYSRFVQEQVAGDVLFPGNPEGVVAMGLISAGPWDESTLRDIREDTLDRQMGRYLDRDDMVTTVMQTFTSTTVHCARCHDHKFDPISQKDYYSLQAVFAGVDRANRPYDADPGVARKRAELRRNRDRVVQGDKAYILQAAGQGHLESWVEALSGRGVVWKTVDPESFVSVAGAVLGKRPDGSLLVSGKHGPTDVYSLTAPATLKELTGVRLEVLPDPSLPHGGPGRELNGNMHLSEFQLMVFDSGSPTGRIVRILNASSDYDQPGWTIRHAIDGDDKTAWGIYPKVGEAHMAVFELAEPLRVSPGSKLTFLMKQLHGGHCMGHLRLSVTDAPARFIKVYPSEVQSVLELSPAQWSEAQRLTLATWFVRGELEAALQALPPASYVYAAASDFPPDGSHKPAGSPRVVQVLRRGEIGKPGEVVSSGALSCLTELSTHFKTVDSKDEGARRAALARWLTDRNNPLLWRSIVNRVWQHHFGRGLVETVNDFGAMGSKPSHPELLDWLAVWFRDEAGGSLKRLHRLLVTSQTYRQRSVFEPGPAGVEAARALDVENRYLSRMNRQRMDAEQVRDTLLQVSGRLDLRMGGPSDQQFELKPGIHVTPKVDYTRFDMDGAAGARRGVYRFLFRTLPDPFMDALDCPAGDQLAPVRTASVTVQQALALWNNAFVARQAEHLGARLGKETTGTNQAVSRAFQLLLNRAPTAEESEEFGRYAAQHGLANLARLLINSNEFMFID